MGSTSRAGIRARTATLLAALVLGSAFVASAQDAGVCAPPLAGWIESFPANGASAVPINALVHVRYTQGFLATERATVQLSNADTGQAVAGALEVIGDELFFIPTTLLARGTRYRAIATGGVEGPLSFAFATSLREADTEAPDLEAGLRALSLSTAANTDSCDREFPYRVGAQFRPVANEASAVDVEYLLYVTRGDSVGAPTLRARARSASPDLVVMSFGLTRGEARSPICISVVAVDGSANVSASTLPSCFQPIEGLAFAPVCNVSNLVPHSPPSRMMWGMLLCICIATLRTTRRGLRWQAWLT